MRSRSASAKAAAIVRNSFDRPLPAISPQVELDAPALQALDDLERVEGGAFLGSAAPSAHDAPAVSIR
jgi:hypothetical protein